jgi:hypothetical protein
MPVTIFPANHAVRPLEQVAYAKNNIGLLYGACPSECSSETKIFASSFDNLSSDDKICSSSGSFLRGAMEAWARHLHLVIRPEDIWFAILVQMNFYMEANAEDIRHLFVDHEGKRKIVIEIEDMATVTLEWTLGQFSAELQKRVKTGWLLDWITPSFTTTTATDKNICNVLMMGMMQHYFSYFDECTCGIPSVTLLGEREDWVKLREKLDRLPDFGTEPAAFAAQLRPILDRFVLSFEKPHSEEVTLFWNRIVKGNVDGESGKPPFNVSGWLTGFYFWNSKGHPREDRNYPLPDYERYPFLPSYELELDGHRYQPVSTTDVPIGYARAPVTLVNHPKHKGEYAAVVVAGAVGKMITPGVPEIFTSKTGNGIKDWGNRSTKRLGSRLSIFQSLSPADQGTLQPVSGWFLFGPDKGNPSEAGYEMDYLEKLFWKDETWRKEHPYEVIKDEQWRTIPSDKVMEAEAELQTTKHDSQPAGNLRPHKGFTLCAFVKSKLHTVLQMGFWRKVAQGATK